MLLDAAAAVLCVAPAVSVDGGNESVRQKVTVKVVHTSIDCCLRDHLSVTVKVVHTSTGCSLRNHLSVKVCTFKSSMFGWPFK